MNDPLYRSFSAIVFILISYGIVFLVGNSFENIDQSNSFIFMSWKIIFLIQLIGFIPSFIFKTDHYFDLTGGITFILIISLATNKIILNESLNYKVVPFFLVFLWAIRLSSFLFLRVKKVGKDIRFDNLKTNFWKFMLSWVVQGFWVFMSLLPLLIVVDSSKSTNIIFLVIGLLVWLFGFLFEIISDNQKTNFRKIEDNKDKFITTGLWKYSRHPNYLGEIVLWTGVAIISYSSLEVYQMFTLVSPIFTYLLLVNVSGINLLEKSGEKKWGHLDSYKSYKENTPRLIGFL